MTIELVPLATMRFTLGVPLFVPDTPRGTRVVVEVTDGAIDGERIHARQKGVAAADWLTLDAGGLGTLDVRVIFETDDSALIYVTYSGRLDLSGGPGTAPSYIAPLLDVGDTRYGWLAKIQAVGKRAIDGQNLTYEAYELR